MNQDRTYENTVEARIYESLRFNLIEDLISVYFDRNAAIEIVNYFDPASTQYLDHVDAWVRTLCKTDLTEADAQELDLPQSILQMMECGNGYSLRGVNPYVVGAVHQVARILIKLRSKPRKETDFEAVKSRLRNPGRIVATREDVRGIRRMIEHIAAPSPWGSLSGRFGPGASSDVNDYREKLCFGASVPLTVDPALGGLTSTSGVFPSEDHVGRIRSLVEGSCWDIESLDGVIHGALRAWASDSSQNRLFRPKNAFHLYGATKVTSVPKSLKSDRIVASEPAVQMYAQLAVLSDLDAKLHKAFRGHVFLHDSTKHNRFLLRSDACSIDLSDASDHLGLDAILLTFPTLWAERLMAVRSAFARFPDNDIVPLGTFACMGSGVCFHSLTLFNLGLCAYAAEQEALERGYIDRPSSRLCGVMPNIPGIWYTVFGDDIICSKALYKRITQLQSDFGLVVNVNKSCESGVYRESCGCEMFNNLDITPFMIREIPENASTKNLELILDARNPESAWTPGHRTLLGVLFPSTQKAMRTLFQSVLPTAFRWNATIQQMEMKVAVKKPRSSIIRVSDARALRRWLSRKANNPTTSPTSLDSSTWPPLQSGSPQGGKDMKWNEVEIVSGDPRVKWTWVKAEDYPQVATYAARHSCEVNHTEQSVSVPSHDGPSHPRLSLECLSHNKRSPSN